MPVKLEVDHQQQQTRATAIGEITLADIQSHLAEEGKLSGLGYRELIDASEATSEFCSEDARRLVELLKHLGSQGVLGPTAVIVSNDLNYGVLRMLEMLLDDVCKVRPFRAAQRAEADKWLASAPLAIAKRGSGIHDA